MRLILLFPMARVEPIMYANRLPTNQNGTEWVISDPLGAGHVPLFG